MSDERPPLGDIKVGDVVRVRTSSRWSADYEATVTKVARVWITVRREGWTREFRFRLDDQTDGTKIGSPDRFQTQAQYAWFLRQSQAVSWLREQRIDAFIGPWANRRLELANILRRHEGLEEL
jgi:hypothetical protein